MSGFSKVESAEVSGNNKGKAPFVRHCAAGVSPFSSRVESRLLLLRKQFAKP